MIQLELQDQDVELVQLRFQQLLVQEKQLTGILLQRLVLYCQVEI